MAAPLRSDWPTPAPDWSRPAHQKFTRKRKKSGAAAGLNDVERPGPCPSTSDHSAPVSGAGPRVRSKSEKTPTDARDTDDTLCPPPRHRCDTYYPYKETAPCIKGRRCRGVDERGSAVRRLSLIERENPDAQDQSSRCCRRISLGRRRSMGGVDGSVDHNLGQRRSMLRARSSSARSRARSLTNNDECKGSACRRR